MRLLAFLLAFASFASAQEKVLRIPVRADGPKTLDPVRGSTQYEAEVCDQVYETLLQYNYLADPLRLEPLLVEEMPQVTDSRIYRFKLKKGVRFRDDPCFPEGKGRELVARGVFYSWKRMAAEDNSYTLDPAGYTVRLYYSNNGQEAFLDDPEGPFVFENVPQGTHAVVVLRMKSAPPLAVAQDTIQVFGNGATKLVEFMLRL